jgi:ubiquinone/menaquinone biosynthesis C-methylase UbiE
MVTGELPRADGIRDSAASDKVTGLSWKGYEGQDYENFWVGRGKQYLDELERLIVSHGLSGGEVVVEIGAGFGRLGQCYVGKYAVSHMVEPASNLREIAIRTYGHRNVRFHEASAEDLPFTSESVDAVLMVRVFHHFGEPQVALREIHRILKPSGWLVFNFSNKRNVKRIAQYVLGLGTSPFSQEMEAYADTLIGHHPRHVERLLSTVGFAIQEVYGAGVADKIIAVLPWMRKS